MTNDTYVISVMGIPEVPIELPVSGGPSEPAAPPDLTRVDASGRRTESLLPAPYSLNRLAEHSGWPEASLRRYVQASPEGGELMEMRSFETAVIAARALKHGHDVTCIRAVNAVAYLSSDALTPEGVSFLR